MAGEGGGLAAAHGQAGDGPVRRTLLHAVVALHILDNVREAVLDFDGGIGPAVRHRGLEHVHSGARGGPVVIDAVGDDDDHRLRLSLGDEVVQDLGGAAEFQPGVLVAAGAVQEVEHGVFALAVLIACRSIDRHAARAAQRGGIVPDVGHVSVRGVMDLVIPACIALFGAEGEDVGPGGDVPVLVDVGRIHRPDPVHDETVGIQFTLQRLRGVGPQAVAAFLHVHAADGQEIARQLDRDGLRREIAEGDGVVGVDFGGDDAGSRPQRLLGPCGRSHQKRRRDA